MKLTPCMSARRAALIATILGAAAVNNLAAQQRPDTSTWECRFCPFESGSRADYAVGASSLDEDAARFGNATGYNEKGGYLNVDGSGTHSSEGSRLSWDVEDLGLDSRVLSLAGGRPGNYGYRASYRQLPYFGFDTTRTVFTPGGGGLVLPTDWASDVATMGFAGAVNANLIRRPIESERKILAVGGDYIVNSRLDFFADYAREDRDGVNIRGGSFFTQSALLSAPFDYQTDQLELGVRYRTERGSLTLAYYGSFFQSNALGVTWDNPFGSPLDPVRPAQGQLAQPPDSDTHQVSLSGVYQLGSNTLLSFAAGTGSMEQNAALLPYTINGNLNPAPLPRSALDGDVDTSHISVSLTAKPLAKARVRFAYRFNDRDNGTSVDNWNRIIADAFTSGDIESNSPYSFQRTTLTLSGDYDLFDSLRLSAGYERKELERDLQEVAEQTEDTGWGRVRWRPNAFIDVNAKAGTARRDIDRYDETLAASLGQNPLLRKYHLAYRYREFAQLSATASLPNAPLTVGANLLYADDSYTRSMLGLLNSDDTRFGLDVTWQASEKTSVYLHSAWEDLDAEQAGSESFGAPDWRATTADEFQSYGAGVRTTAITDRVDLQLDYTHGDGSSEINVRSAAGTAERFPDLESDLDSLRLTVSYRWTERLHAMFQLRYENFEMQDWALAGVRATTIPTVLALGASPYDYDVLLLGISLRYQLGDGDITLPDQ